MSDIHDDAPVVTEREDRPGEVAAFLEELVDLVEHAKSMPLSSSAIICARRGPGAALRGPRSAPGRAAAGPAPPAGQRRAYAVAPSCEAGQLLDEARAQAAHMVQRTEVVRQARRQAERLVADAESEARRIRHEADDYVDRKLAAFEIVLDRTIRTVQAGRERLAVVPAAEEEEEESRLGALGPMGDEAFFDQDTL